MTVAQMRDTLSKQYNGALKWRDKVAKMSDSQVIAIFYRLLRNGSLSRTCQS